jgi:hypothetical protein
MKKIKDHYYALFVLIIVITLCVYFILTETYPSKFLTYGMFISTGFAVASIVNILSKNDK